MIPLRSLPRVFVPGATPDGEIELPKEEIDKLRKVLRLSPGAEIAVLPDDGTLIRCEFASKTAIPKQVFRPATEPSLRLTIAQALPKGDKLDEIVRACTELGVARFILFPSDRSVVRWDADKLADRLNRLRTISREAAEVSYRTRLPTLDTATGLAEVLRLCPDAEPLSESEGEENLLLVRAAKVKTERTLIIGPEGGWSERELALIGPRGITLGPRVLRVDHAAAAAAALLLIPHA